MNTNDVAQVTELGHRLFNLPGWLIVWSFTLIMCAALKKNREFPDKYAWPFAFFVCGAGTVIFAPNPPTGMPEWKWHVMNFLIGAAMGTLISVFYATVVSILVGRFPALKFLVPSDTGNTMAFFPPKAAKPTDPIIVPVDPPVKP